MGQEGPMGRRGQGKGGHPARAQAGGGAVTSVGAGCFHGALPTRHGQVLE